MKTLSLIIIAIILLDMTTGHCQITTFHGTGPFPHSVLSWDTKGNTVVRLKNGKYIVGGVIDEEGPHGSPYFVKPSISGTTSWERIFLGDYGYYSGHVVSAREYGAGAIVATGHIITGGYYHTLFLKIDQDGNPLITKGFMFNGDDFGKCIQVVKDVNASPMGTVIVGTRGLGGFIHVTNGNGERLASRLIEFSRPCWVEQTTDGFLVLGGDSYELHLIKFSNDLSLLWGMIYRPAGIRISGTSFKRVGNSLYITGALGSSPFLMQLSIDGTFNWANTYGSNGVGMSIATAKGMDNTGGIFITGKIRNAGQDRAFILNTDFNGNRKWSSVYALEGTSSEGREIIPSVDSLLVTGDNDNNMLLVRTDLYGASGSACQSQVTMQARSQHFISSFHLFPIGDLRRYEELKENPVVDKFDIDHAFCNSAVPGTIGGINPDIIVYPNVAVAEINIDFKSPTVEGGIITLLDAYNELIKQVVAPSTSHVSMDVSGLKPGIYYLLISTDGTVMKTKFIKE